MTTRLRKSISDKALNLGEEIARNSGTTDLRDDALLQKRPMLPHCYSPDSSTDDV
jgi:hypothetical protein